MATRVVSAVKTIDATGTGVKRRLFSADEYYKMAEIGVLHEGDHIELIEGEILEMSPIGTPHISCVMRLNYLFNKYLSDKALVSAQNPVQLGSHSEPEPDIVLLKPREDFYETQKPKPADVLLLIEVSDFTLEYDRETKLPLYGKHGVKEVWIVNLPERQIEVYREPFPKGFREMRLYDAAQSVSPLAFPTIKLPVKKTLGEPPPPKRSASPQPKKR